LVLLDMIMEAILLGFSLETIFFVFPVLEKVGAPALLHGTADMNVLVMDMQGDSFGKQPLLQRTVVRIEYIMVIVRD